MAAQKENLLSLWHLTGKERNIFTTGGERSLTESRAMRLVQRLQELKERELVAQQHNRQLLQQFEEAQATLRDMLTLTANMKTIRMEYERYLEESAPRWQQQLKEKTQAALRKRTEECCKSCLQKTDNQKTKSPTDGPLLSQGPATKQQKSAAPQEHYTQNSCLDYNQNGSPLLPHVQASWLTLPQHQTAHRFPIRTSTEPQGSYHVPPSFPSPSFPFHYPISTPAYHHHHRQAWPRQDPPLRPDHTWFWDGRIPAGSEALWGLLYPEAPPPGMGEVQGVRGEAEMSTTSSSEREVGGESRSRGLSQELDIKPVRLSSGSAESSGSSRVRGEKRKKRERRGRSRQSSSDKGRCSSRESSRTPSAPVAQSSESEVSSQKSCSSSGRRRGAGLGVESPDAEKAEKKSNTFLQSGSQTEESESTVEESRSEEAGDQSPEVCGEETGAQREEEEEAGVSIKEAAGGEDVSSSCSGESSVAEKDEEIREQEEDLGDGDDEEDKEGDGAKKEQSQRDEDEVSGSENTSDEEAEVSGSKNTTAEEEESEEEEPSGLKNEGAEDERQGSASSHGEEVDEDESGGESEDAEEEEEQSGNEAAEPQEESDSDDSIISPQIQSKTMQITTEEAGEEDEDEEEEGEEEGGSKTGSSDDDDSNEFSDEDIENLLAPEQQPQTQEKDVRTEDKNTVICDKVEIFQAEPDKRTKTDHQSDSDEFDNFYD